MSVVIISPNEKVLGICTCINVDPVLPTLHVLGYMGHIFQECLWVWMSTPQISHASSMPQSCLKHASAMPQACLESMPLPCLSHASAMPQKHASTMPQPCLYHASVMPQVCLSHASAMPQPCLNHASLKYCCAAWEREAWKRHNLNNWNMPFSCLC